MLKIRNIKIRSRDRKKSIKYVSYNILAIAYEFDEVFISKVSIHKLFLSL